MNIARSVLEELVATHGEAGKTFSACEVFTSAPASVAGADSTAAWNFSIVGKTVEVSMGEVDGADFNVRADYQSVLPVARLVYTPEILAKQAAKPPAVPPSEGSAPPAYLVELHNRLAVLTL